jgi:hypothetical protein
VPKSGTKWQVLETICATLLIPDGHLRLVGNSQTYAAGNLLPLVSIVSIVSTFGGRGNSDCGYQGRIRQSPAFCRHTQATGAGQNAPAAQGRQRDYCAICFQTPVCANICDANGIDALLLGRAPDLIDRYRPNMHRNSGACAGQIRGGGPIGPVDRDVRAGNDGLCCPPTRFSTPQTVGRTDPQWIAGISCR